MTKVWFSALLAVASLSACKTEVEEKTTPAPTSTATAAETAAATPADMAMAATTGATAAATESPAAMKEGESTNVLGLDIPKFTKGPNWQFGVTKPKPWPAKFDSKKDYFMTMHTTKGDMTIKFFPELAPKHVTNFIYLAQIGYYDDAPFHRVCQGFMMQGGDPSGRGTGGPAYNVEQEFNARKHKKGILSMARTGDPNGAGSQFFVMFQDAPFLDNQYTVFGEVVEGLNVVDAFHKEVAVPQSVPGCKPKSLEKIKTIDVFTKDKK